MKKSKGFTFIELVTVITIVGILATVVSAKYYDISTEGKKVAVDANFGILKNNFNTTVAKNLVSNPSNPYVSMTTLNSMFQFQSKYGPYLATNYSGFCLGTNNAKLQSYTDKAGTTATSASSDIVKYLNTAYITDTTNCPV